MRSLSLFTSLAASLTALAQEPSGAPPEPRPSSLEAAPGAEAERLFEEGKGLLDNLDLDAAVDRFSRAALFHLRHPADAKPARLAEACVSLGATLALKGDAERAMADFRRALVIDPEVRPTSELFGDDIRELFSAVQLSMESQPQGTQLEPLAELAQAQALASKQIARPPPPKPPLLSGDLPPLLKKWWFWAAVGGATMLATGAMVAGNGGRPAWDPTGVVR